MSMKARVFNVMQYEKNPETGEDLHFGEENILSCVEHKTVKDYAYIRHDKDVYSEKDEVDSDGLRKAGGLKPAHWHVVIRVSPAVDVSVIAKWLGIPENFVDVPKGRGAFLDCVEYLTHGDEAQLEQGKYHYPDEAVKASFDWKSALIERAELREKYHRDEISPKEQMRLDVMLHGKTLRQVQEENPLLYLEDETTLRKARSTYLSNMNPPALRINYYIDGKGGIGKSTAACMVAKALFPDLPDDECYFEVGANGVTFEGYDGQPVIIWHDVRAGELIKRFGRGNVFNIFDNHPKKIRQNVKFSSASLVNTINILEGIDDYNTFLTGISGEYVDKYGEKHEAEDENQGRRRFPFIVCLREYDFDLLVNRGFAYGTFEFDQYIYYRNIVGNFGTVLKKLDGMAKEKALLKLTDKIVEEHDKIVASELERSAKVFDEIPDDMKDYGEQKPKEGEDGEGGFSALSELEQMELPFT